MGIHIKSIAAIDTYGFQLQGLLFEKPITNRPFLVDLSLL